MAERLPITRILAILREAERQGNIRRICQQYAVTERNFYRWRNKYADLLATESALTIVSEPSTLQSGGQRYDRARSNITQMRTLEIENRELKHLVAELTLKIRRLRDNAA